MGSVTVSRSMWPVTVPNATASPTDAPMDPAAVSFGNPERPRLLLIGMVVGAIAWAGLAIVGTGLYQSLPRRAGFDLELVLAAGRRLAAGAPLYDPGLTSGGHPARSVDLFFAYPPPVAQVAGFVGAAPSWLVLVGLAVVAVTGMLVVADRLAADRAFPVRVGAVIVTGAALPLVFPFSVGLLFGNLSVLVPVAIGLVLAGLVGRNSSAVTLVAGLGLAAISIAKIAPAIVGLWLLVRWAASSTEDARVSGRILGVAVLFGAVTVAVSLATVGADTWSQYVTVLQAAARADLIDPRNLGPAASLAAASGGGESAARVVQLAVLVFAGVLTVLAARFLRDPVASLSIAAAAILVVLPVTWFHYAAALIPFAIAAGVRAMPRLWSWPAMLVVSSVVISVISIAAPPLIWAAVATTLAAAWTSGATSDRAAPSAARP